MGFVLEDCCKRRVFHSRSRSVGRLVLEACRDALTLCVVVRGKDEDKIRKLSIKA